MKLPRRQKTKLGGRSPRTLWIAVLLAGLLAGAAAAADPAPRIEDFEWLVGSWLGEGLGGTVEEIWSPARAGVMVGTFRLIKDDAVVFYEILTLSERDGRIQMRLKHFDPELVGWEEKADYVTFDLEATEPGYVRLGPLEIRHTEDRLSMALGMRSSDGTTRTEKLEFERYDLHR